MTNDAAISAANGTGRICEVIISNAIGSGGISLEDTRLMRNSKDDVGSLPNFSNEQQPGLLKLIENIRATSSDGKLSGKRCEVDWLLNSGASYHMTGPTFEDADRSGYTARGVYYFHSFELAQSHSATTEEQGMMTASGLCTIS
ncbi:unnamed protein product [Cuscuta epithymum]|uniref:Uncharacterized protein n=1 Tax=Cuscuta epithymum TaxID=186058 RepID=A0AAV0FJL4_9ASTE|nr:unnamed protein product [Cuscuta epithymum]